nr:alpha-tocopherol transfer protein-like [Onthophagus taurus]
MDEDLYIEYNEKTGEPFLRLGENILKLDREEISGEFAEKAFKELRETPENRERGLDELRNWLKNEENFFKPNEDTAFLLKFLRPCKFYAKSAFKIMKKFYKFKEKNLKYSQNLIPESVERCYIDEIITFLPARTLEGSRIMVVNIANWNPKEVSVTTFIRGVFIALEIAMGEPKTQVGGVHVILNLEGLSLSHITQFNPSLARMILQLVQECLPLRLKGIHIINQLTLFKVIYAIFKPFIGEKLKKRLFFHGTNYDELLAKVDSFCLPPRWGGTLSSPDAPGRLLYDIIHFYSYEYKEISTYGYTKKIET